MPQILQFPAECALCGQTMAKGTQVYGVSGPKGGWTHAEDPCPKPKQKQVKQQNIRRDPVEYEQARHARFPHEVKCGNCGERMEIPAHVRFPAMHYHPRCNGGRGGDWIVGGPDPEAIEVGSATHRELVAAQRRERVPVSREDFLGPAPLGENELAASDDIPF
jgi:ribosomal protein S27E